MSKVFIPAGYKTPLSVYEMQRAIEFIKSNFQVNLGQALNLRRVSAPLFVREDSGLNDNLNGVERPDLVAYDENRNLLYNSLREMGYECAKPDGAFYLFVKAPNGDANVFSEKAKLEHNLLVVPADGFGCPGYFRLSYCVANDMIRRSLPAFKAMIESYK